MNNIDVSLTSSSNEAPLTGIFDSHAHYNDERFNPDRAEVIKQILKNGVSNVINIGADIETSKSSVALAVENESFYATVGVHPHDCEELPLDYINQLKTLAKNKKVVAIGEIGLDYHFEPFSRETQIRVFKEQLTLAKELSLPVVIHSRDATVDTLDILNEYKPIGVLHCFSGSAETAKQVLKLGMYLGFTGVATFKNARKTLEVVKIAPLEKILLETDCPYMAPEPFRGQRCQSDMIGYTAKAIAEVKGISTQNLIDIAAKNTKDLFNITF